MSETSHVPPLELIEFLEALKQLEETARGYREHLLANGWSETMAEMVAASMLTDLQRRAVTP